MMKKLILYLITSLLFLIISFYVHTTLFQTFASRSTISLIYVYTFFGLFSLVLCVSFLIFYHKKKFKDQLGFLYLASVALKIVLFSLIFGKQIFIVDSPSPRQTAVNLLIPILLTLFVEVFMTSKILNNSTH